ncbi:transposase [Shewanella abyssi]|uniref:IS4/Tn5 family transposase DNA-binding protein n=1 Tax=Shewanella abyssi TaxID=311789 RepID=UPI00200D2C85|nr:transposase [Shewanella abyssi]MCL1050333.1 transposase [Shewanella abyssi]
MSIFNADEWATSHFQQAKLGGMRRADRLVSTAANMARSSGKSIALSCRGNEAELEGAYPRITKTSILISSRLREGYILRKILIIIPFILFLGFLSIWLLKLGSGWVTTLTLSSAWYCIYIGLLSKRKN